MSEDSADSPVDLDWLKDQINDLRGSLRAIDARLRMLGLDGDVDVPQQIAALEATVGLIAEELATAIGDGAIKQPPPAAIDWPRIPNHERRAELSHLGEWVDQVLAPYYPGSAPPACWRRHPDVVINLSLIHLEWQRIYNPDNPALKDALDFHDRWFPNVIRRMRDLTANCNTGTCAIK